MTALSPELVEIVGAPVFLLCNVYATETMQSGIDIDAQAFDAVVAVLQAATLEEAVGYIDDSHRAAPISLYAALRWSGATDAAPFADVKVAADKTPSWEKRDAYSQTVVSRLERCSEGATLLVVLLGAHAGLRVSEMTALRWEHVNLGEGVLKVVEGRGGKTARVYLTPTLVHALEATPLEQRSGYVLPCRSRQAVYQRLEAACKQARVTFKGVHALRHAAGTRLREATGDLALVADHLRHSSLDTARGYAKSDNRQLKKALGEW